MLAQSLKSLLGAHMRRALSTPQQHALFSSAPSHYDVVIAGGGVMGCSAAYHLASTSNFKIAVVEKDCSYKHASAMLSAGGIRHQFSRGVNVEMSQYGSEFLASVPERMRIDASHDAPDIQFVEGGYLFLASHKNVQILYDNYETQRAAGSHVVLLTPDEIKERFPWISTEGISAATLGIKHEGWFDPWSYLVAMKKKCVSLGVDVLDGEVKSFDMGANNTIEKVHIEKKEGGGRQTLTASKVVNAAGPWASKILEACGSFDYPVKPRKRTIFVYHCPHEDTWKGKAASPLVVDPNGVYFRREGSCGQFICGWSPEEADDVDGVSTEELNFPDHEIFEEVIWPTIATRVQKFEDIKVMNAWSGFYEYNTFDQNAIMGIHSDVPNLYLMNGFSGHGLQQSPAAGRAIAELIVHGEYKTIDASCFNFQRVRDNEPFLEQAIV
uniref:FAD-dependent oxidoreductase domain-containing protein 1 n=1 Tax=Globisporangium ultimum (strain ATCC 200006 / CBS 805.95 / DAOM BR144) TaxID=431595 RepID=K3WQD6_GLOUD